MIIDQIPFLFRYEVVDVNEEIAKCQRNRCAAKAGDNRCDEECNSHFCNYDGGDCRLGINPWKMCNVTTRSGNNCWDVFNDGRCNAECNSKECLFDGRDCSDKQLKCNPNFDGRCSLVFNDGVCNADCNNAACGWDGLDCLDQSEDTGVIPGSFQIVLSISQDRFDSAAQKRFERYLSLVLRTNLRIKRYPNGQPMITPFNGDFKGSSEYAFNTNLIQGSSGGIIVYLEIDNAKCDTSGVDAAGSCFDNAEGYANLFGALLGADHLKDDWGIVRVGAATDDGGDPSGNGQDTVGIVVGVVVIALVVIVLGVVTQTNNRYVTSG